MLTQMGKLLVCLIGLLSLGLTLCAPKGEAQIPALGNVTITEQYPNVDCGALQADRGFDTHMVNPNCYQAEVTGCANSDSIYFYYGVAPAQGTKPLGTIVMLSGHGGATIPPTFPQYVTAYVNAGYQVVELVWGATYTGQQDWEFVDTGGGSYTPSILTAACRPASVLNWIRNGSNTNQVGQGIWSATGGGMCVHGDSGGAGATAYALAWYYGGAPGAPAWGQGYIDKAVLENGPVFSDIEQGCEFQNGVNNQSTYICARRLFT
jgi:hypothetical protein